MNNRIAAQLCVLGCVGGVSFLAGSYTTKHRARQHLNTLVDTDPYIFHVADKLRSKPCLPYFGTVSAATAIVPHRDSGTADASTLVFGPSRISQIMKYGFPGMDNIRSYSDFVLSYDRRNKVPHWVFEHLTPVSVTKSNDVDRAKCDFQEDTSVHPYFRSANHDYKGSGFDRGHMAAAGNHRIQQQHCNETFNLSNIAPQVGVGFNRDIWNKLESYVRKLARKSANVYVCTGPLYLPQREGDGKTYVRYQVIGKNAVAVPTHFFKIVVYEQDDHTLAMESYVMPNQKIDNETPLKAFLVPPESVERHAGLLFFDKLSKQQLKLINGKKV